MTFRLNDFIPPSFNLVEVKDKKRFNHLLNLSTNELIHPDLALLNKEYRKLDTSNVYRCYPCLLTPRQHFAKHFELHDEQVLLAPGSDFLINLILFCFGGPRSLIVCDPEYYSYQNYANLNGYRIHSINIIDQSEIGSLDQYIELLKQSPSSLVALSNPNGVTGLWIKQDQMRLIAETCLQKNHFFIIDEAYSAFYQIDHRPLLKEYENILIIKSFSKSHGIAGLRFAAAFSSPEAIRCMRKTGIENAISSISINYYLFLLTQIERIHKIQQDIIVAKSVFIHFIAQEFPDWHCYTTATHFCVIDVKDEAIAHILVDIFKQHDVMIKFLGDVSKLTTCIRITIGELSCIKKVFAILQDYKKMSIQAVSYV